MTMRGAVAGCLVLVCFVAMLAERVEGHIAFISPKEMREMREREGKKVVEPRSEDGQFEEVTIQQRNEDGGDRAPDKTVEIAVRLTAKQLENVAPVLEEIIHDMVVEAEAK